MESFIFCAVYIRTIKFGGLKRATTNTYQFYALIICVSALISSKYKIQIFIFPTLCCNSEYNLLLVVCFVYFLKNHFTNSKKTFL